MNKSLRIASITVFTLVLLAGCVRHVTQEKIVPGQVKNEFFVIVTATSGDTLESLAQTYLKSRRDAWKIAQYNHIRQVTAGDQLVIPLKPIVRGGVYRKGYQVIPVLLYPKIVSTALSSDHVSAEMFEEQVQHLKENGYRTISLEVLGGFFDLAEQVYPKAIVISFDSSERWVYEIAFPILKRYGYTAAVFIPTAWIGASGHLNWKELAEMAGAGFDIGANGMTARDLTVIPPGSTPEAYLKVLEDEIILSGKAIADHLKLPHRYFAYPEGKTNDLIVALLKQHGYTIALTREHGNNPFFVNRYKVHRRIVSRQEDGIQPHRNLSTFIPAVLQ